MNGAEALLRETFPSDNWQAGSAEWHRALFRAAYVLGDGPFADVLHRLGNGFSVLAYVPGNCMRAAAEVVKADVQSFDWKEYLRRDKPTQSLEDVWRAVSQIVDANERGRPGAIFHNLDFLTDSTRGGVYPSLSAQTAAFGLVEGARYGVVFGMSDREEPELPSAIARAFDDKVRIEEIPYANFHRILPRELGEQLRSWGRLNEGTIWLLASRLRWTDPVRAHRVMLHAMRNAGDLDELLATVVASTCTVDYVRPEKAFAGTDPEGFREEEMRMLRNDIIKPYERWKHFRGTREECLRMLDKLPPGAILFGPPGTGKTYLARWIARSIGLPVRVVSGGSLRAVGWGEAERNVRALFRDARRAAPCVLILDDADDLLPDRNKTAGAVAAAERAVVNEFLQQMQGLHEKLEGVLVILTTNRIDSLDPAACARLPVQVRIPYPTEECVKKIVKIVGDDYDYDLEEVTDELVALFREPIVPEAVGALEADSNRFSPREIRDAMRRLESWDSVEPDRRYKPTAADVERVRIYYQSLPGRP